MAEAWPVVLKPSAAGFWITNTSRSGGVATNGQEQVISSGGGRWRARVSVPIRSNAQLLAVRALMATLDGRAGEILVPVFDGKRANWPVEHSVVQHPGITHDKHLDGTAYEDDEIPAASEVEATVNANAALGAMSIAINMTQGAPIKLGQYFGIFQRLYVITAITSLVGSVTTVAFKPRLRAAVLAGAPVKFTRPVCKMRQMADDQGPQELELMRFADLTLDFDEIY